MIRLLKNVIAFIFIAGISSAIGQQISGGGGAGGGATLGSNTFTGVQTLPTGSTSSISLNFGTSNCGLFGKPSDSALAFTWSCGGTESGRFTQAEMDLVGNAVITWGNQVNTFTASNVDTAIKRNAAGVLEVNNGAGGCSTPANCRDLVVRHQGGTSTAPTASACAGFALGTGSSDLGGRVTFTSATSCAISFGVAYTNAPFCWVMPNSATSTAQATTSTTVLTATFGTAQTSMFYGCVGI